MQENIDILNTYIDDGKCLLMIGPDIAFTQNNNPIHLDVKKFFEKEQNVEFDNDNFLTFKSNKDKTFFINKFKKFYDENSKSGDIHKKIAQIPFNFIISVSPDVILKNTFDSLGIPCIYDFYDKKTNPKDIQNFSSEKPLIYNLFGCIKHEESLILTYDDLFEFLFAILDDKKLPRSIKEAINNVKVFLFIGFDFEKWYMRLILKMLNLNKELTMALENNFKSEPTKNFFIKNLEMELLPDDFNTVITQIYNDFSKKGKLRQVQELSENPVSTKVKDFVKQDDLEQALEMLEDFLSGKDEMLSNQVTMIFGQLASLTKRTLKGIIGEADAKLERNVITDRILTLANEIKNI